MADRGEVHQNDIAVGLLQRECRVDGGSSRACATFGTEERKDAGFTDATAGAGAFGTEARKSLEQSVGTSRVIQIFAGARAHAGDDRAGLKQIAIGEGGDLQSGGANQFDSRDGALRLARWKGDNHDFRTQVLNLSKN